MSEYAERLLRRIEAVESAAGRNRTNAELYQRMTEQLSTVRGRAVSPDGLVQVLAGADGTVYEVTFGEQVRTAPPSALSASVVHTIAAARADAARAQAEVVRRNLGDSELLEQVVDADERVFGDRPPADPGPPPATAVSPPVPPTAPGSGPSVPPRTGRPPMPPRPVARPTGRHRANDNDEFDDVQVLMRRY